MGLCLSQKEKESQPQHKLKLQQRVQQHHEHTKKKSWLLFSTEGNKKTSNSPKSFMLDARTLSIVWADHPQYWRWVQQEDESGRMIELAELKSVCWLEVTGKFDIGELSRRIVYQISFVVMLKDSAIGWNLPIIIRLLLPGGNKQEHQEYLGEKSRECWIEIPVGEFMAFENDVGMMEISLHGSEGLQWKKGLVIQGIAIKPKNQKTKDGAYQSQQEPQSQPQSQQQQQQQPHKLTRKESRLASSEVGTKSSFKNSTKPVQIATTANYTNCFMLRARTLQICWADNPEHWSWTHEKDASGKMAELAILNRVCWLEVYGKFNTKKLSPRTQYQVSFIVMLKNSAQGWEVPINVRLVLPGNQKQEHKENLKEALKDNWIEIPVGEFTASDREVGDMEISMYEYEGGAWKTGLVIQGIVIKPIN